MALTYVADPARLVEIAFQRETTRGTYIYSAMTQPVHDGCSWGRGHTPIEGAASTSTSMMVITHRAIRGLDNPAVNVNLPWSPNTQSLINELITGSVEATNAWAINDFPNSYSICTNIQREAGVGDSAWNFAGCYVAQATLALQLGQPGRAQLALRATSQVDPQSAVAMPALTPVTAQDPWVLKDCTFVQAASDPGVGAGTTIPIRGITWQISRGLIPHHASSGCEPDSLTPSTFDCSGRIEFLMSPDLWGDLEDLIAKENDGGYTTRYLRFSVVGGSVTQRMTMPVRLDLEAPIDANSLEGGIPASVRFQAAGDDATPTVPTLRIQDV